MKHADVIILGAGAAGLMAAYTLGKAGKKVMVLEARDRTGGRIHTAKNDGFAAPTELGAEFIHGDLPVTLNLLKEAGIQTTAVDFEMWQHHNGSFEQSWELIEGWETFLDKLNQLQQDMPLTQFLDQYFAGPEYAGMRDRIQQYVAGYDTADVHDASAFALRNEWNNEDEAAQHRVAGGYSTLTNYLATACQAAGGEILLNTIAREISWKNGTVKITDTNDRSYTASKLVIALPLGILQANPNTEGAILFNPVLQEQATAFNNIGFGSVIKILLEFREQFWANKGTARLTGNDLSTMGFLLTREIIPTYWTQAPTQSPLLTGWLGGPPAYDFREMSPEAILQQTLTSLSHVFKTGLQELKHQLVTWKIVNWATEPYTRGSYAYDKVESAAARAILKEPVEDTIYFAGEYLYEGPAMGTVEAALTSGEKTAARILSQ